MKLPALPPQDQALTADLRQRAELGDAAAQMALGLLHHHGGNGALRNDVEALKWFSLAASQGHPAAQFCLACLYDTGCGVARDSGRALEWYQKAATHSFPLAQFNIGIIHLAGDGVARDPSEAARWLPNRGL